VSVWIVVIVVLAVAAAVAGLIVRSRAFRRRQYAEATQVWLFAHLPDREKAMHSLLDESHPNGPAWYLCGCACLTDYRTKQAARAFGMAHHADSNLETAALLTFACLKASDGEDSDLIEQITTTWHEMKRPDVLQRPEDRLMLDCLEAGSGAAPGTLSPLGRMTWLAAGPALRERVERLVAGDDSRWAPLRKGITP